VENVAAGAVQTLITTIRLKRRAAGCIRHTLCPSEG